MIPVITITSWSARRDCEVGLLCLFCSQHAPCANQAMIFQISTHPTLRARQPHDAGSCMCHPDRRRRFIQGEKRTTYRIKCAVIQMGAKWRQPKPQIRGRTRGNSEKSRAKEKQKSKQHCKTKRTRRQQMGEEEAKKGTGVKVEGKRKKKKEEKRRKTSWEERLSRLGGFE